jgi:hypothetical protein
VIVVLRCANGRLTGKGSKFVSGFVKCFSFSEVLYLLSATCMAADPLPLDGNRKLEETGTYRYLEIVVLATPPRSPKVFVVFVIDPGKSSFTVAVNAARGLLTENDVIKLDNQSEMSQRCEDSAHFSSGRRHDERSTRDVPHTEG